MVSSADPALVRVRRGGFVEAVHRGALVVVRDHGDALALGDVDSPMLPRSALKPLQAVAMLECGLDLDGDLLALAGASHSGEAFHRTGVLRILARAGLPPAALRTTPGVPADPAALAQWHAAGRGPEPIAHNCSGKHAAMLLTCVRAGWPVDGYLDSAHPLQAILRARIAESTGYQVPDAVVDGCGAPAFATSLRGLARAFGALASAAAGPSRLVADAFRRFPQYASGTRRDETVLHRDVAGLVAKMGAEGTLALGLADGTGIAVKVSDGHHRAAITAAVAVIARLGHRTSAAADPVLGHGIRVGTTEVTASLRDTLDEFLQA